MEAQRCGPPWFKLADLVLTIGVRRAFAWWPLCPPFKWERGPALFHPSCPSATRFEPSLSYLIPRTRDGFLFNLIYEI